VELSRGSKLDGVPKLVRFQPIPTLFAEEGLRETRQASSLEKVGQFYPSAQIQSRKIGRCVRYVRYNGTP